MTPFLPPHPPPPGPWIRRSGNTITGGRVPDDRVHAGASLYVNVNVNVSNCVHTFLMYVLTF